MDLIFKNFNYNLAKKKSMYLNIFLCPYREFLLRRLIRPYNNNDHLVLLNLFRSVRQRHCCIQFATKPKHLDIIQSEPTPPPSLCHFCLYSAFVLTSESDL